MQRFRYEIKASAKMRHPNIVQIYEVLELEGRPVCVMEYVDGPPLHRAVSDSGVGSLHGVPPKEPLDYPALASVFVQAAKGLAHAHANGMIHRDIKPGNILLTPDKVPKILDFGIAKRSLDAVTQTAAPRTHVGQLLGTPSFMSPEQAAGDSRLLTNSTDVYSLGATLYYCLTRKLPHRGRTVMEIINKVKSDPVELPTSIDPTIPRDLEAVCLKAMEKQPGQRYPTALAFAEDLENYLNHRPIKARPYDFREKLLRAVARRKELFMSSVVLILLMFAGLIVSQTIQYRVGKQSLIDDLRSRLEGVAATAALLISASDVEQIRTPADKDSAPFVNTVATLKRVKQQNPNVVFVYLMRESQKAPGKLEFVAEDDMLDTQEELDDDGNGVLEGLEIPVGIGDVYQETDEFPAMRAGLTHTTSDPDTSIIDEYGVSLSGYSPIRNSDGTGIAVLGVDMLNDDVVRTFRAIRRAFVLGVVFSTLVSIALLGFVVNWIVGLWMRPSS
jgi:serine/threonine protein kinase